jgi:hypothetical protein
MEQFVTDGVIEINFGKTPSFSQNSPWFHFCQRKLFPRGKLGNSEMLREKSNHITVRYGHNITAGQSYI